MRGHRSCITAAKPNTVLSVTNDDTPTQRVVTDAALTRSGLASGQKVFSRYTLEAQIGRGGMGVVWRARDEKLDRPVALKFLPPEVAADAEAVRDLKLETRRCLDLTHLNIVRVYDFIEEEAAAAIAMEYVEGESLAKIKASAPGGCLGAAELTPFVAQLCAALRYAHQVAKVAHHDLKPANVLVTRDGVVKVTDFGIARSLTETQTRLTGRIGNTSGTLLYMSPQQMVGEKPTATDDLYALGALLYELLTGKPPFFRGDPVSLRQQVLEREPAPLLEHRRDVGCTGGPIPPEWSETILACLAKKPENRPATADEVASRLGIALEPMTTSHGLLTTKTTTRTTPPMTEATAPRRSLVPWLISVGAVIVGLAAAGIYFGVYVPEQDRIAAEQERAHRSALAREEERARQAEAQRKAAEQRELEDRRKDEEARAQLAKDQEANAAILAKIAAISEASSVAQINETQWAVRNYTRTAPIAYRGPVAKAWTARQSYLNTLALAARPGGVMIETNPTGATVTLYPQNEHKTSPALFDGIKPGDVALRVELDGYESRDVSAVVKPAATTKVDVVQLVPTFGSLAIASDPPDVYVLVEGSNGRRYEGHTPYNPGRLTPGDYRVTYQRPGWHPQIKTAKVERGKTSQISAELKGVNIDLRSSPPGAEIAVDQQPKGIAPLKFTAMEPGEYQITATLEGYEVLRKKMNFIRSDTIVLTLTEKPMPRALHEIAGDRWHSESSGTTAELNFTAQGKVVGKHHSRPGGQARDVGIVDNYNVATGILTVHFTTPQGKPLYIGAVQIKLMDPDHLVVVWRNGDTNERLIFERDKVGK
jgi:hypothetical protein